MLARSMRPAMTSPHARAVGDLAHARGAGGVVIGDAAALDAPVVVHERPRRAVIAVEGHADRARGDELDLVRADAVEGDVEVAEDQPPVGDAFEQLELVGARLGPEGGEVGLGRGVPRARVVRRGRRSRAGRRARRSSRRPASRGSSRRRCARARRRAPRSPPSDRRCRGSRWRLGGRAAGPPTRPASRRTPRSRRRADSAWRPRRGRRPARPPAQVGSRGCRTAAPASRCMVPR